MEEERKRHIQARTKPSARIGPAGGAEEPEPGCAKYELAKDSRYRVDKMGMDTSWKDYQFGETALPNTSYTVLSDRHPVRKPPLPRLQAERARKQGSPNAVVLGPQPPTATEDLIGVAGPKCSPRAAVATVLGPPRDFSRESR